MSEWNIGFISREDFKEHVGKTIQQYLNNFQKMDVKAFNKNVIDPVKMLFDKTIYNKDWETLINDEIARQRDKSNTNGIGYFHQNIFSYISRCTVPSNGDGGFDVIFTNPDGIPIPDGSDKVTKIYVEMKNKHNTMNSASADDTYQKMQNKLLEDDDCYCALVEVIASKSQNIIWKLKKKNSSDVRSHKRIRRISIDKFYEIVTGDADGFYKICMVLPEIINEILKQSPDTISPPKDSVIEDLQKMALENGIKDLNSNDAYMISMFLLGFGDYNGFGTAAKE